MAITVRQQSETIEKLLKLAAGDRELVHEAIKAEVDTQTGEADLARVVKRILDRLAHQAA